MDLQSISPSTPMKPRHIIILFSLGLAAAGEAAIQEGKAVAQLSNVNGNVLVSGNQGLASGSEALRLPEGVRIITTTSGQVSIRFDDGCVVPVKPGQRFEVRTSMPCGARQTSVKSMLAQAGTVSTNTAISGAVPAAGTATTGAAAGSAAAAGTAAVQPSIGLIAGMGPGAVAAGGVASAAGLKSLYDARQEQSVSGN